MQEKHANSVQPSEYDTRFLQLLLNAHNTFANQVTASNKIVSNDTSSKKDTVDVQCRYKYEGQNTLYYLDNARLFLYDFR